MIKAWLCVLLLLAAGLFAVAQNPSAPAGQYGPTSPPQKIRTSPKMQASPPVPRQAPNNSAQAPIDVDSKSAPSQKPAEQTPASDKADRNRPAKNDGGEQHPENDGNSIIVRQLPPVTVNSPRRDWADWGTWLFNLFLVGVGALQVILLCWTLRVIRIQAGEMKRQRGWMRKQWGEMSQQTESLKTYVEETKKIAKSTADSVQIIINKERARIRIEVSEHPILPDGDHPINELKFKVFCDGSTPAFIVAATANLKVTDSKNPSSPSPNNIPMGLPTVLHPNIEGMEKTAIIWQVFEEPLGPQLLANKLFLHFYGVIEYTDAFEISRSTKFRYLWAISDSPFYAGRHGYWIKNGEKTENSAN